MISLTRAAGALCIALALTACEDDQTPISLALDQIIPVGCVEQRVARAEGLIASVDQRVDAGGSLVTRTRPGIGALKTALEAESGAAALGAIQAEILYDLYPAFKQVAQEYGENIGEMSKLELAALVVGNLSKWGFNIPMISVRVRAIKCPA